jgi:hypothetical protein
MPKIRALNPLEFLDEAHPGGGAPVPPFVTFKLSRPAETRLTGDRISYRDKVGGRGPESVTPTRQMLGQFLRLAADADDSRIERFAKTWGPLGLCPHGASWLSCLRCRGPHPNVYSEPVATWRQLAREADALLRIGASLQSARLEDSRGSLDRVKSKYAAVSGGMWEKLYSRATLAEQRGVFALQVCWWLRRADTIPWVTWGDTKQSGLGFLGVFGAVGAQLFEVLAAPFALCAGCGRRFRPRRLQTTGKRAWCDSCRANNRPQAQASQDCRARKKARRPVTNDP